MPEELWSTDIVYQSLYLYLDVKKNKKNKPLAYVNSYIGIDSNAKN